MKAGTEKKKDRLSQNALSKQNSVITSVLHGHSLDLQYELVQNIVKSSVSTVAVGFARICVTSGTPRVRKLLVVVRSYNWTGFTNCAAVTVASTGSLTKLIRGKGTFRSRLPPQMQSLSTITERPVGDVLGCV